MPLSSEQRLEGELGVKPADLGLSSLEYTDRLILWEALAEETQPNETLRYFSVKSYLLRTWITKLTRDAEKFRAEGELTVEKDVMARIELLRGDLLLAQRAAGGEVSASDSYGPIVDPWGVC